MKRRDSAWQIWVGAGLLIVGLILNGLLAYRERAAQAKRLNMLIGAFFRDFLVPKRSFILGMLQNPNLLEHQEFAETLWAAMHLTDEVTARRDLSALPEPDMAHLKTDYPYLFALAVRTNPFDPTACVEVTG
jgi:hypothetical protein